MENIKDTLKIVQSNENEQETTYNLNIKNNETGEVILDETINAILCAYKKPHEFKQLCLTDCSFNDMVTLIGVCENIKMDFYNKVLNSKVDNEL